MSETMNRPGASSIFSRLEYLSRKMDDPKISSKEMKTLKIREKNLLEMMEDGMEEFNKGGAVRSKPIKMKAGGLVGGQVKLDKNKDGQISGADFKMMEDGGAVTKKKGKSKKSGGAVCRGAGAAIKGTRFSGVR